MIAASNRQPARRSNLSPWAQAFGESVSIAAIGFGLLGITAALGGTIEGRKPPMTFYVYKATGGLSKNVWELVSELDNYDDAVAVAEKLCPRGGKIETEPGNGLPKAYFGPDYHDRWKAMISKRQIFR
jgi:hypothetical protein